MDAEANIGWRNDPVRSSNITTYYTFDRGKVEYRLLGNLQVQEDEKVHLRWEYVAAVKLWGLWRSRCKLIFKVYRNLQLW